MPDLTLVSAWLLTRAETAKLLKTSERSVDRMIAEGVLPVVRIPGRRAVRILRDDVAGLIEAGREERAG